MVQCKNCKKTKVVPYLEYGALWCKTRLIKVQVEKDRDCEYFENRIK